jgi:hypothetical protein
MSKLYRNPNLKYRVGLVFLPSWLGDSDDVRTYGYKAERAAALIYAHFKKEFDLPITSQDSKLRI